MEAGLATLARLTRGSERRGCRPRREPADLRSLRELRGLTRERASTHRAPSKAFALDPRAATPIIHTMSVAEVTGIVSVVVVGIGGLIVTILRDRSSRKEAQHKAQVEAAAAVPRLSVAVRVSSRPKSNEEESDEEYLNHNLTSDESAYIVGNSESRSSDAMTFRLRATVPTPSGELLVQSGYLDLLAKGGPLRLFVLRRQSV